jgi:hypothetical protein
MTDDFLLEIRRALLIMVDAIERLLGIEPRTKECRDRVKGGGR